MSTRCQIAFFVTKPYNAVEFAKDAVNERKWKALLYRHSDGYPGTKHGVVAELKAIVREFVNNRPPDPEYLAAYVLYRMKDNMVKFHAELEKNNVPMFPEYNMIGHGVCSVVHVDIEYLYYVYWVEHGTVAIDVFSVSCDWDEGTVTEAKLEQQAIVKARRKARCK